MGEERRQNTPLTPESPKALIKLLEEDWEMGKEDEREQLEEVACFVLASYVGGLRGEEAPLIYLGGMLEFWKEGEAHSTPHVMITLLGRFKGEDGDRFHCLPVADKTKSGIPIRKWFTRLLLRRTRVQGRTGGWLFCTRDKKGELTKVKAKLAQYDPLFKDYMTKVKDKFPGVIPEKCDPLAEFSLWRSGRRGSTTEAGNQKVGADVIEMNNRWRKKMRAKGAAVFQNMRMVYTNVRAALLLRLRYSQSL